MNQEKIGKFIARCRKDKKITQAQLAEQLGVSNRSVSKWENGRGLPDVSLFFPLCEILEITINEFLNGERLPREEYQEKLEEGMAHTIDYVLKQRNQKRIIIGGVLFTLGLFLNLSAVMIFPSESSWSSWYSVLGSIITIIGFSKIVHQLKYRTRIWFNSLFIIVFATFLLLLDFCNVKLNQQPPMFSIQTITIEDTIFYNTPFYDAYRCHVNSKKEYYIIEKNQPYSEKKIRNYCE